MRQTNFNQKQRKYLTFKMMLFVAALSLTQFPHAQVTIGEGEEPVGGALLQLKNKLNINDERANATKGLALPRVDLTSRTDLFPMYNSDGAGGYQNHSKTAEDPRHAGLMVYNLSTENDFEEGIYVWDGEKWMPMQSNGSGQGTDCSIPVITSPAADMTVTAYINNGVSFIVNALPVTGVISDYTWFMDGVEIPGAKDSKYIFTPISQNDENKSFYCKVTNDCGKSVTSRRFFLNLLPDPSVLPPGIGGDITGSGFTGRTCFDINRSNFSSTCGTQQARAAQATDFTALGGVIYTFTAPSVGMTKNLRFMVADSEGCVSSYSGIEVSGTMSPGAISTLTIYYKASLNDENSKPKIYGRTSDAAAKVTLYAVYNYNGSDVSISLRVSIQDCTCCMGVIALQSEYMQKNPGYMTSVPDISPNSNLFIATGRNLCIYKTDAPGTQNWAGAVGGCTSGVLSDGSYGWRLPNGGELGIMYGLRDALAGASNAAPGTTNMKTYYYYWSGTEYNSGNAWNMHFAPAIDGGGRLYYDTKNNANGVRCVRAF